MRTVIHNSRINVFPKGTKFTARTISLGKNVNEAVLLVFI